MKRLFLFSQFIMSVKKKTINFIFFNFLIFSHQCDGAAKSRRPNGYAGDVRVEGCTKITCIAATKSKGVWSEAPSMWVSLNFQWRCS